MSSSNHYYDANLLGAAPKATKAQRQEGYNIDLLNQRRPGKVAPRSETAVQHPDEKYVGASRTPFFRSTKGRIAILIAVIVIIGVVVGGAVGGTVRNKAAPANTSVPQPDGNEENITSTETVVTDVSFWSSLSTPKPTRTVFTTIFFDAPDNMSVTTMTTSYFNISSTLIKTHSTITTTFTEQMLTFSPSSTSPSSFSPSLPPIPHLSTSTPAGNTVSS